MRKARLAFAFTAILLSAVPTLAQQAAPTKWDLPTAFLPTNYHVQNLQQFAEEVKAATSGKLELTLHTNASLFKAPEIKRAVQTGMAQAGEVLLSVHENEDPLFGLDMVPFLATSFAEGRKLYEVSKAGLDQKLQAQGLKLLYAVPWPPQGLYTKKDINSIADLKGARWRSYNVGTSRMAEFLGANPVIVQSADLPQALATGVINAFITSSQTGVDSKVWESMTHFYDLQAWIPKNVVFVNRFAFERLDAASQASVMKAAEAAEKRGWALAEETTRKNLELLAQNGVKVIKPNDQLMKEFRQIGEKLIADWQQRSGSSGAGLVTAYQAK